MCYRERFLRRQSLMSQLQRHLPSGFCGRALPLLQAADPRLAQHLSTLGEQQVVTLLLQLVACPSTLLATLQTGASPELVLRSIAAALSRPSARSPDSHGQPSTTHGQPGRVATGTSPLTLPSHPTRLFSSGSAALSTETLPAGSSTLQSASEPEASRYTHIVECLSCLTLKSTRQVLGAVDGGMTVGEIERVVRAGPLDSATRRLLEEYFQHGEPKPVAGLTDALRQTRNIDLANKVEKLARRDGTE